MIDLWATWCAPCKKLAKETFTDPLVVPKLDGFILAKIDVMQEEHASLSAESLPKVYFARSDGKELKDFTLNKFEKAEPFAARLDRAREGVGLPPAGSAPARETAEGEASPETPKKVDPVQLKALTAHDVLPSGESGYGAIEMTIEPGWHVYWKYPSPGDLGEPVRIQAKEGSGVSVGPIEWPTPLEFLDFGEFTTFGYEKSVTLAFPVTLADDADEVKNPTLTVDWLVCNGGNCIPASKEIN